MDTALVFLFGAGASKGAAVSHVLPETPPLMGELYDRLAARFPDEWGPSSKRAAHSHRYRQDFEEAFTEVDLGRHPGMPAGIQGMPGLTVLEAQRTLASYFASFALDGSGEDLYSALLGCLKQSRLIDRALFASLNYDCLFEEAAVGVGFHVDYLLERAGAVLRASPKEYESQSFPADTVHVAKLHGSANFVTQIDPHHRAILSNPHTQLEVHIDAIHPPYLLHKLGTAFSPPSGRASVLPVMTQISYSKDDFLAPAQLQQVRGVWNEATRRAERLIVIGVAPREHDTHVWEAVQEARGEVLFIGADSDFDGWKRCNARFRPLGPRLEDAFPSLLKLLGC